MSNQQHTDTPEKDDSRPNLPDEPPPPYSEVVSPLIPGSAADDGPAYTSQPYPQQGFHYPPGDGGKARTPSPSPSPQGPYPQGSYTPGPFPAGPYPQGQGPYVPPPGGIPFGPYPPGPGPYTTPPPPRPQPGTSPRANPVITESEAPDHFLLSCLTCLFCVWPISIFAIAFSIRSKTARAEKDYQKAKFYGSQAWILSITSMVIGVIIYVIIFVLMRVRAG